MANIHPSKETHEFLEDVLAHRTGIRRNIWARIAVARSLNLPDLPDESVIHNSEGKELARQTILGDQDALFKAMFILKYQRPIDDDEFFPKLFKLHLERGSQLLKQDWELSGGRPDDFYSKIAENLPQYESPEIQQIIVPGVGDIIKLEIGSDVETKENIIWELNKASNPHMAVVGTTGSGKTQFIKELIIQIVEQTDNQLPFIFFDYARGDVASDNNFVNRTNARVVTLPNEPVPLNPFPICHTNREVNQLAHHIAKIFRDVAPQIGIVQEQRLVNAVQDCYPDIHNEPPDFYDMRGIIEASGQMDSLTSVISKLTDLNLFPHKGSRPLQTDELLSHSWIIDLHKLQELKELVVFLMLDSLRYHFVQLKDQNVKKTSGAKELRCLFIIDEAHNFLPRDNSQVLEKCLRELRGKGVAVWLLTQNPRDLNQPHYNYVSEINYHLCLRVLDVSPRILSNIYGVPINEAKAWSAKLATFDQEGICRSPALSKGFSKVKIRQFWER